jgi:hypothetical protein
VVGVPHGLSSPHPWESGPWTWLVNGRPILLWNPQGLTDAAGDQVIRYILMVGTPTLWLAFAPALVWAAWRIVARRDPVAVLVAVMVAAGWGTWFLNPSARCSSSTWRRCCRSSCSPSSSCSRTSSAGREPRRGAGRRASRRSAATWRSWRDVRLLLPGARGLPLSHAEWVTRMWFPSWF